MIRKSLRSAMLVITLSLLTGCASYYSQKPSDSNLSSGGLGYYLPKRDIIVTIEIDDGGAVDSIVVGRTASYPDLEQYFEIQPGMNWLGSTEMSLAITPSGLLSTANSKQTSGALEVAQSLAQARARSGVSVATSADETPSIECDNGTTNSFVFTVNRSDSEEDRPCGLVLKISERATEDIQPYSHLENAAGHQIGELDSSESRPGIYYRQDRPYTVKLSGDSRTTTPTRVNVEALVFSPSESGTLFLPITRSFFGNNDATIGLNEGVPTTYGQKIDGEGLALLKLPAEVLSAYFTAVGQTFSAFGSNAQSETQALQNQLQLELHRLKFEACLEAIRAGETEQIQTLGC